MQIWVDADACPRVIKDILFRAAEKRRIPLILVANQALRVPSSQYIRCIQVGAGFDAADGRIVAELRPGDLVVTADIPLAAAVLGKGGHALDPRGTLMTTDTIGERLMMRNVLDELRGCGVETGGPPPLSPSGRQAFANKLDAFLTRHTPVPAISPP
ncbi:MAG: YaiI/YqxD family protein [Trichloromonas sp.]|jgi:uncharacterized protein YaiI (UPF0178 family)|nr:YaiI/YqxD family protein [Trichloromonas sp.]